MHATTYFATRILYQRGKLDLQGVMARLHELLRACPDFPEARAMLQAAERGTLQPDPQRFNQATVPPPAATDNSRDTDSDEDDDDEEGDRLTEPGNAPSRAPSRAPSVAPVEARLKTPQAPGIPRAPLVPRFTPRENVAPSYVPPPDLDLTPPGFDLDLLTPADSSPNNDTVSAPPPSSTRQDRSSRPPGVAIELGPLDGLQFPLGERNTAPSQPSLRASF